MFTLPIKKQCFDLIFRKIKTEEYRELSPYYKARLHRYLNQEIDVVLRNGYSAMSPAIRVKCLVTIGTGKPEWGAVDGKEYYVLKILEIVNRSPECCYANSTASQDH